MKTGLFIFLLIFLFCVSVFPQTGERVICPNVDVVDVAQKTRVGEVVSFTAQVDTGGTEYELKYYWHVVEAEDPRKTLEILSGQGTSTITVVQVKGSIIATVEVGGLPRDCLRTSSEASFVDLSSTGGNCPGIEFTGPAKSVHPGELIEYSVHVETGGEEIELEYIWAAVYPDAETGKRKIVEIVSGQGTPNAQVRLPKEGVTISVIIGGIREGCPMMASETVRVTPAPDAELVVRFSGRIRATDKARVNKMWDRFYSDPNGRGVIFLAGTVRQIKANKKMIMSFFTRLHKDAPRITFIDVESENEVTEAWFVPAGADEPEFKTRRR